MDQGSTCDFVGFCALFSHEWLGVIATGAATMVALWLGVRSVQDGRRQSAAISTVLSSVLHAELEQCLASGIVLWEDIATGRPHKDDYSSTPNDDVLFSEESLANDVYLRGAGQRVFTHAIKLSLEKCQQNIGLLHHLPKPLLNEVSTALSGLHVVRMSAYRVQALSLEGGSEAQIRDELESLRVSLHKLLRDLASAIRLASLVASHSREIR